MAKISLKYWIIAFLAAAVTACCLVDDDLSDCDKASHVDYELRLITNMTTELQTQLSTQMELTPVATALKEHLKRVFTDYAHDVDLSFYDVKEDSVILHKEEHIMDANQSSYTLFIPVRRYMHLAVANLQPANPDGTPSTREVFLLGDEKCHTSHIEQPVNNVKDVLPSHTTGIFSARLPMDIMEGVDQHFDVKLYMVNCASAVALDTLGSGIKAIQVYSTGYANGFNLADSTYYYKFNPKVSAKEVNVADGRFVCFCTVNFPSRDVESTKTVIDTDDPYVSDVAEEALWQYMIYTTTADGSITETILGVKLPLRAGQFKLIRAKVEADGSVLPREAYVGASVTLKWNERPGWDIDF